MSVRPIQDQFQREWLAEPMPVAVPSDSVQDALLQNLHNSEISHYQRDINHDLLKVGLHEHVVKAEEEMERNHQLDQMREALEVSMVNARDEYALMMGSRTPAIPMGELERNREIQEQHSRINLENRGGMPSGIVRDNHGQYDIEPPHYESEYKIRTHRGVPVGHGARVKDIRFKEEHGHRVETRPLPRKRMIIEAE